jgi:hypothetical protein
MNWANCPILTATNPIMVWLGRRFGDLESTNPTEPEFGGSEGGEGAGVYSYIGKGARSPWRGCQGLTVAWCAFFF